MGGLSVSIKEAHAYNKSLPGGFYNMPENKIMGNVTNTNDPGSTEEAYLLIVVGLCEIIALFCLMFAKKMFGPGIRIQGRKSTNSPQIRFCIVLYWKKHSLHALMKYIVLRLDINAPLCQG